mgnify:CR=1 FL=1
MTSGSLRVRLLIAAALSILGSLFVAHWSLLTMFERHVERRTERELDNHLRHILALIDTDQQGRLIVPEALSDPRFELPFSGLYWQIVENGTVVVASPSLGDESITLPPSSPNTESPICVDVPGPRGKTVLLVTRDATIKFKNQEHNIRLAAAVDHDEVDRAVQEFGRQLALSLAVLGLCLIAAAWLQVVIGLRPLEELRKRLLAMRSGGTSRLVGTFPDEVKPLVDEINGLMEAQQQSLERARARAGELAHGLKTPLTALNTISRDLAARGERRAAAEVEGLVGRMQAHVSREVSRAHIAIRKDKPAETPLLRPVEQLVSTLMRAPRGQEVAWEIEIEPAAAVAFDAEDLAEMLGNLLENALKWASKRIRISALGAAPAAILIEDDGPGVPDEKLATIRVRGQRLDETRDGAGLGLAIVSDIVDAYGYRLDLSRSELGGLGARILLTPSDNVHRMRNGVVSIAAE